jgi:hypothetical protein
MAGGREVERKVLSGSKETHREVERVEKLTPRIIWASRQEDTHGLQALDPHAPCVLGPSHEHQLARGDNPQALHTRGRQAPALAVGELLAGGTSVM